MPPSSRRQASAASLYLAVAVGSGLGAVLRHGVAFGVGAPGGAALPLATLSVNIVGSFVIGFFATLTGPGGRAPVGPVGRQFVMAGLCGGLTTFSIFSLETMQLLQTGRIDAATSSPGD